LCVCAFVLVGCGPKGPKKVAVSGTITVDGEPIDVGAVKFDSLDGGMSDGCKIKDGKFECEMTTGEKKVVVTAASKVVGQFEPDPVLNPGVMADQVESMDLTVFKQEQKITVEKKGQTFEINYTTDAE
ncbi:MAG: hypothetical protein IKW13_07190, partial [Thermoguttaceae bacterium]|nr:hypothetical protein [Thermoguttaceae bacterium]